MNLVELLRDPLVRRIAEFGCDVADRKAFAVRDKVVNVELKAGNAPEIFEPPTNDDRALAWDRIAQGERAGLWRLSYAPGHRMAATREEKKPRLSLKWSQETEVSVRSILGRPASESYSSRWREAVLARSDLGPEEIAVLVGSPIQVGTRSPSDVLEALLGVKDLAAAPPMLREVSSRLFWGMSKILDKRQPFLADLLKLPECPFPLRPVPLRVDLPAVPTGILFVENSVSFERLRMDGTDVNLALVECGGSAGSAARIRRTDGRSLYFSQGSMVDDGRIARFVELLDGGTERMYFWGDLDWSGMAILKALRNQFPELTAWEPGYAPMLETLLAGSGHGAVESRKQGQKDPGTIGCAYADGLLMPALRRGLGFVDQE